MTVPRPSLPQNIDLWSELRSATEACAASVEHVDTVSLLLLSWPHEDDRRDEALAYTRGKLGRVPCNAHTSLWDVVAWCLEGAPALKRRLGMFQDITDRGIERWLSVLAWTLAVSVVEGAELMDVQATATYEIDQLASLRQIFLMTHHDGSTYVLDTHHGAQHLCMGIVSAGTGDLNLKWPGFPDHLHELAWGKEAQTEED